ncbi:hypothetical protein CVT24_009195 [Panaeolus cyanescens]|uniref:Uncharacterized protein n=1 Tax=Panaeolus cyanescens TaxID=181874 RepID=A0A409Y8J0_9AGAR|nr:hypothetical protein CVT24_009195 [Panaeolus cyanescens]
MVSIPPVSKFKKILKGSHSRKLDALPPVIIPITSNTVSKRRAPIERLPSALICEIGRISAVKEVLSLGLCSRHLYNLLLPILYASVDLKTNRQCKTTLIALSKRPEISFHVRSLRVHVNSQQWTDSSDEIDENLIATLIARSATNRLFRALEEFEWDGREMPKDELWKALRMSCQNLKRISTNIGDDSLDPNSGLWEFSDLRLFSLRVRCHSLEWIRDGLPKPEKLPRQFWAMLLERSPYLESLTIGSPVPTPRLFDVKHISYGRWAHLRKLVLGDVALISGDDTGGKRGEEKCARDVAAFEAFLEWHGRKRLKCLQIEATLGGAHFLAGFPRGFTFNGAYSGGADLGHLRHRHSSSLGTAHGHPQFASQYAASSMSHEPTQYANSGSSHGHAGSASSHGIPPVPILLPAPARRETRRVSIQSTSFSPPRSQSPPLVSNFPPPPPSSFSQNHSLRSYVYPRAHPQPSPQPQPRSPTYVQFQHHNSLSQSPSFTQLRQTQTLPHPLSSLEEFAGPVPLLKGLPLSCRSPVDGLRKITLTGLLPNSASVVRAANALREFEALEELGVWMDLSFGGSGDKGIGIASDASSLSSRNSAEGLFGSGRNSTTHVTDPQMLSILLNACPRLKRLDALCFTRPGVTIREYAAALRPFGHLRHFQLTKIHKSGDEELTKSAARFFEGSSYGNGLQTLRLKVTCDAWFVHGGGRVKALGTYERISHSYAGPSHAQSLHDLPISPLADEPKPTVPHVDDILVREWGMRNMSRSDFSRVTLVPLIPIPNHRPRRQSLTESLLGRARSFRGSEAPPSAFSMRSSSRHRRGSMSAASATSSRDTSPSPPPSTRRRRFSDAVSGKFSGWTIGPASASSSRSDFFSESQHGHGQFQTSSDAGIPSATSDVNHRRGATLPFPPPATSLADAERGLDTRARSHSVPEGMRRSVDTTSSGMANAINLNQETEGGGQCSSPLPSLTSSLSPRSSISSSSRSAASERHNSLNGKKKWLLGRWGHRHSASDDSKGRENVREKASERGVQEVVRGMDGGRKPLRVKIAGVDRKEDVKEEDEDGFILL